MNFYKKPSKTKIKSDQEYMNELVAYKGYAAEARKLLLQGSLDLDYVAVVRLKAKIEEYDAEVAHIERVLAKRESIK
jgi:hypothetical protein